MTKGMTLGIIGTAKNTGKTTVTSLLLHHLYIRGFQLGITSIGYDGELVDTVTNLPKPRLTLYPGIQVATAKSCLRAGSLALEILKGTDFETPLGRIYYGEVKEKGRIVLAGPNNGDHLQKVITGFWRRGCDLVLIDGALNRMAPMVVTKGLILATGAALEKDDRVLGEMTRNLESIFQIQRTQLKLPSLDQIAFLDGQGRWTSLIHQSSLLHPRSLEEMDGKGNYRAIYVPGILSLLCMEEIHQLLGEGGELILGDPIKLLLSGEIQGIHRSIERLRARKVNISLKRTIPLLAITVNPFYPKYSQETGSYEAAFVEAPKILKEVRRQVIKTPVFDVLEEPEAFMQYILQEITFNTRKE